MRGGEGRGEERRGGEGLRGAAGDNAEGCWGLLFALSAIIFSLLILAFLVRDQT